MIHYNINKEKRTIAAYITFPENKWDRAVFKEAPELFEKLYDTLKVINHQDVYRTYPAEQQLYNKMFFPAYMCAKTKCSPEDNWDEEYGKELARMRLTNKIHQYRNNAYTILRNIVDEIEESL